jgi:hypothetical protein
MRYLVLTALAMLGSVQAAWAEPCAVDHLDWLKGAWRADNKGAQSEERWTAAAGGVMLGSAWAVRNGKAVFG